MGYKRLTFRIVCLAGVALAAIVAFTAVQERMWANLVFGLIGVAVCAIALNMTMEMREAAIAEPETPAPRLRPQPVGALLDQVPIPLLKAVEGEGLYALNLAARRLMGVDDFISDPPAALVAAVARAERGVRPSIQIFGNTYALGVSEVTFDGRTERFISLTNIQAEVRIAEATALGDTLRVISHEIMNSLTPVASLAETARHYLADGTPGGVQAAEEAMGLLEKRAKGLKRFVEGYRSLARLPKPDLRRTNVSDFVKDVVRVFEQSTAARDVRVSLDIAAGTFVFDMDEALMAQALINVLTNAAEATHSNAGARCVAVTLAPFEHDIGIVVADNGSGVETELRERIFHGFLTTKPEGAGIGLSLARQITLAHGGNLSLLDRDGVWRSEFLFRLPGPDAIGSV